MRATEFVTALKDRGFSAWEAEAVRLAQEGGLPQPVWREIELQAGDHVARLKVSADVLSIGDAEDSMRLPLTPGAAQTILNGMEGALLPTPKIVYEIWRQADVHLVPSPMQNRGPNLTDYLAHSRTIDAQLSSLSAHDSQLIAGHKKDVVVSNLWKPGRLVIYGWFFPPGYKVPKEYSQPIQGRSDRHDDRWVDYSHGIRLVHPRMVVDGIERSTEEVYQDPVLSALVSDEGPLKVTRYPGAGPILYPHATQAYAMLEEHFPRAKPFGIADLGLAELVRRRGGW
jgi:hypothetical protein